MYDNDEDWVLVAPITAASLDGSGNPIFHKPFEIFIAKQSKRPSEPKEFHFKKDSVIQVDQVRRVSKFRVVNKSKLKLRNDLLNQIDNIIIENFTPKKAKLLEKIKIITQEQNDKINEYINENNRLNNEINNLCKKVDDLTSELEKYKLESFAG